MGTQRSVTLEFARALKLSLIGANGMFYKSSLRHGAVSGVA